MPGDIFGYLKCTVLPPQNLYHPVLLYRSKDGLLFPLCRTCADTRQCEPCKNTIDERSITGTWITPELDHAIQRGYTVLAMYEAWHFALTAEYDHSGQAAFPDGLFGEYVDALLKIKQEASGWPGNVRTEADKLHFVMHYEEVEG